MKKQSAFLILFFAVVLLGDAADRIKTNPRDGQIFVGTLIRFSLESDNPQQGKGLTFTWDFGVPGSTLAGQPARVNYTYKDPGRYTVRCTRSDGPFLETNLTVNDNRRILFDGSRLIVDEQVQFTAKNFNSGSLRWDADDGTVKMEGKKFSHIFKRPGVYTVKVFDFNGESKIPVEARVKVERDNREIVVKPQVLYVGAEAEIEGKYFKHPSIKWDFGDGMSRTGGVAVKHTYNRIGPFFIKAVDFGGDGSKEITQPVQVTEDNRAIRSPDEIIAGEAVDLSLENVPGGNFTWTFPDGEKKPGQAIAGKIFPHPGLQILEIVDSSGKYPPLVQKIMVKPDLRTLQSSTDFSIPGVEVDFDAIQFKGPTVKWNFGDGTVLSAGGNHQVHQYEKTGTYRVTAVDFGGQGSKVFSKQITIEEQTPDFRVTHIELTFSNGKYYAVVGRRGLPPRYRVKIKARGSGILKGQWLLDKKTLGLFEVVLLENRTVRLQGKDLVRLPLIDEGLHNFTFDFTNYTFNRRIPRLRYFVTESKEIKIRNPLPGSRVPDAPQVKLSWFLNKKNPHYQIAVSEIPFQFLDDDQIEWREAGNRREFSLDLSGFDKGDWIYWCVREVGATGKVGTTSNISSFRVEK